jgi:haloacetate dehalogenase
MNRSQSTQAQGQPGRQHTAAAISAGSGELFAGFSSASIAVDGAEIFVRWGGSGPPVLLLHGYPQTHAIWHQVAPALSRDFTVVVADLRGYGDSSKPSGDGAYAKRVMARDQVQVMSALGFDTFCLAGHDRGARVTHRMVLDHPDRVLKAAVLDIVPTEIVYDTVNKQVATDYFHWYFLIQPNGLPERLIAGNPEFFLRCVLSAWAGDESAFDQRPFAEYKRCMSNPETIRAMCEDFRASASVDLIHDREDDGRTIETPFLVLWGARGPMARSYDVLETWTGKAKNLRGKGLDCGHFLPEEAPAAAVEALRSFFLG